MKVHRVAFASIREVGELKLLAEIVQQEVLNHENKMFIYSLEHLNFVVQLDQNGLCRHLPVDAIGLAGGCFFPDYIDSNILEVLLACWPDRSCCVKGLEFNANKVLHLAVSGRGEEVINATSGDGDLRDDVQFVSWFVNI